MGACLVGAPAWWLAVHGRAITESKKGRKEVRGRKERASADGQDPWGSEGEGSDVQRRLAGGEGRGSLGAGLGSRTCSAVRRKARAERARRRAGPSLSKWEGGEGRGSWAGQQARPRRRNKKSGPVLGMG